MKYTIISILVAVILIGGAILFTRNGKSTDTDTTVQANNVSIVDGKQIIKIYAKGGYKPKISVAKTGIPTIIQFETNGTFDCSSYVRIPSIGISKILPQSGVTDIDIGTGQLGVLQGTCGMGMYPFQVNFQS